MKLSDELDASLRAFCEALHRATKIGVISDALEAFIYRELSSNPGLSERYEAIRKRERRRSQASLKIVEPK